MNLTDTMKMKGFLRVRVLDAKTRKELQCHEVQNVICIGALKAVARLLAQDHAAPPVTPEYEQIWTIRTGTGTTAPSAADTELDVDEFPKPVDKPITNYEATIPGLLEAQMTMEGAEGNGVTYKEAALFSRGSSATPPAKGLSGANGDLMYARQLTPPVEKTSAIAIEYTWRYQLQS